MPPALFPSFFMAGFESSTHVDRSHRRQDYIVLTQHDRFYRQDYERVRAAGVRVVREGLRWHLCERGGRYDFSSVAPMAEAAQRAGILQINCLLHYGFPDDVHPFDPSFVDRFAAFGAAFARWRARHVHGPRWYAACNETSLFSFAGAEAAWFAPFFTGRGAELKRILIRAALAAQRAVVAEDASARFLSIDPVMHQVAPRDRPDQAAAAARANESQWEAWDATLGRRDPELGGWPGAFDVVGVNCYPNAQTEYGREGQLALDDPRGGRCAP